jgi:hypothetical protein
LWAQFKLLYHFVPHIHPVDWQNISHAQHLQYGILLKHILHTHSVIHKLEKWILSRLNFIPCMSATMLTRHHHTEHLQWFRTCKTQGSICSRGSGKNTVGRMNTFMALISSFKAKSSISYSSQWCQHLLKWLHTITENWDCLNNLDYHNQNSENITQLSKPVSATLHLCSFTSDQVTAPTCNLTPHSKSHIINIFKN